jgi:hypothetical protein
VGLDFFQWLWVPSIGVTDETKRSVVGERMSETLRGLCGSVPANALVRAMAHSGTARADSGSGKIPFPGLHDGSAWTATAETQISVSKLSKAAWISRVRSGQRLAGDMGADHGRTAGIRFADRAAAR